MYNVVSISDYYRDALEKIRSVILHESEEQIIGSNTEELAQYYYQLHFLNPIETDDSKDTNWEHQNYIKSIPAHKREHSFKSEGDLDFPCERIRVEMPIETNEKIRIISKLQSSTYFPNFSEDDFAWNQDSVSFLIETKGYGFSYDEDKIASEVNNGIVRVNQVLQYKNNDIQKENLTLLNNTRGLIENRKQELQKNKEKIQSLTQKIHIPVKKKTPQGAKNIILDPKPIVKRIKPSPVLPEEYVLDENKVNDILDVLDNQAKSFERTPGALVSLGEQDLRDLLLANLNSLFEGRATGETFSKKGKSDIYLNIDSGNILVFECKIWGGEKIFNETIDQLRRYLTWRHNFGVIIFFVKIKSFSKVLAEITKVTQNNQSFKNSFKEINKTHFCANHVIEGDEKEVKIHYLFYNLFIE